jgi:Neu-associated kinase
VILLEVKLIFVRKQLDENETRKFIRQIVSAVDHMHRAHVIHRDIKLQNFMLDQNNDIVIIGEDESFQ